MLFIVLTALGRALRGTLWPDVPPLAVLGVAVWPAGYLVATSPELRAGDWKGFLQSLAAAFSHLGHTAGTALGAHHPWGPFKTTATRPLPRP